MTRIEAILLGLVGVITVGGLTYHFTQNDFKDAPTQIGGCTDPAVTAVVYSIDNYPDSWESDSFQMWHDDDVSVWTGNEDYGLSLTMGSSRAQPDQYVMNDQCRAVLYEATQEWLRNTLNEKLRD